MKFDWLVAKELKPIEKGITFVYIPPINMVSSQVSCDT